MLCGKLIRQANMCILSVANHSGSEVEKLSSGGHLRNFGLAFFEGTFLCLFLCFLFSLGGGEGGGGGG